MQPQQSMTYILPILMAIMNLSFGQQPSCSDVIKGYNVTREEYSASSTCQVTLRYGYNLFYSNGSWIDYENGQLGTDWCISC